MTERPKFWTEELIQDVSKHNISGELQKETKKRKKGLRETDIAWDKIDSILNKSLYERDADKVIDEVEPVIAKNRSLKQSLKYKLEDLRAKATSGNNKDVVNFVDKIITHFFEKNSEIELHD